MTDLDMSDQWREVQILIFGVSLLELFISQWIYFDEALEQCLNTDYLSTSNILVRFVKNDRNFKPFLSEIKKNMHQVSRISVKITRTANNSYWSFEILVGEIATVPLLSRKCGFFWYIAHHKQFSQTLKVLGYCCYGNGYGMYIKTKFHIVAYLRWRGLKIL